MENITFRTIQPKKTKMKLFLKRLKRQKYIQGFVLAGMLFIFIFSYIPMFGILMAFKEYSITSGIAGIFTSKWVGLKHFYDFFEDPNFLTVVRNTFVISLLKLFFTFPIPIIFAIMLNELKGLSFKKFVQTVSYLPHFISWVVVSGLVFTFLSADGGVINSIFNYLNLTEESIPFLTDQNYFWGIAVVSDAWKGFGWWAIIFLAAIAGINTSLYESADIDGASRLAKIWYITLPGLKGAITIVLILSLGKLLGGGLSGSNFEQCYLLGNRLNLDRSEIIQTYVLKVGLAQTRYSYATAVGLLQSLLSVIMIFGSNAISRKFSESSLF